MKKLQHTKVEKRPSGAPWLERSISALESAPSPQPAQGLPRPLPPLCLPEAPCSDSRSGPSSGLNSWLMATPCSLVTSETMIVDLRRSSMCTDCHSPGTQAIPSGICCCLLPTCCSFLDCDEPNLWPPSQPRASSISRSPCGTDHYLCRPATLPRPHSTRPSSTWTELLQQRLCGSTLPTGLASH
uniref:Uncharacterized protein n=1 Tax=Sus scrofa TaxID=9823 RepID=A0A4X1UJ27_PIG